MGDNEAFRQRLRELVEGDRMSEASNLAQRYWSEPFTGRYFHELADGWRPDEFTEQDILAVSMLGVDIPAPVTIWLLSDEGRVKTRQLLEAVPTDVDIWDAGELLAEGGELWSLWSMLRTASWPSPNAANGMGRAKISKLLATKRPRLVPIWDSVVRGLFPPVDDYWDTFATALADAGLFLSLSVASSAGAPDDATLLRKLDAMLWMIGKNTDW